MMIEHEMTLDELIADAAAKKAEQERIFGYLSQASSRKDRASFDRLSAQHMTALKAYAQAKKAVRLATAAAE